MRIRLATQICIAGGCAATLAAMASVVIVKQSAGLAWYVAGGICLLLGVAAGFSLRWFFKRHTGQITSLVAAMEALSGGNFGVDVETCHSGGEVQVLVDHFNHMRENMQSKQRGLKRKARRDRLTGLFNRSYFDSQLPLLEKWAIEKDVSLSALMVDLDNFKAWNDGLGHAAGDRVLQCVAGTLRKGCRDTDLIARLGGDEFVVIALGLDLVAAASLAERLRGAVYHALHEQAMSAWGEQEDDRTLIENNQITLSIGVAMYSGHLQKLVENADSALYEAKRAGRNRVKVFNKELVKDVA